MSQTGTVLDVSEVKSVPAVTTSTEVKSVSGVTKVVTTNVETIKESKEYQQITDFLIKNHPEEDITVAEPVVEKTNKYQRSVVKTVVFKK